MPIKVDIVWPGITPDQYESALNKIDFTKEIPSGLITHIAGFANAILRITEVWAEQSSFDIYLKTVLMPTFGAQRIDTLPEITISEIIVSFYLDFGLID